MKTHELIKDQTNFNTSKPGIYLIHCPISNKGYVGQAKNIRRRWNHHRSNLKNNKHHCPYLQNYFNKYGSVGFYVLDNRNDLNEGEVYWFNQLDEDLRVNIGSVGNVISPTKVVRKNMSEAAKRSWEINRESKTAQLNALYKYHLEKKLSDHEVENILCLLETNMTVKEIAFQLDLSINSVIKVNSLYLGRLPRFFRKYGKEVIEDVVERKSKGQPNSFISKELNIPLRMVYKLLDR